MEFPLSLKDSTRAEDARPVEFPLSLTDSTRAEDARPVEFPLSDGFDTGGGRTPCGVPP